jgi:hypothetical protein
MTRLAGAAILAGAFLLAVTTGSAGADEPPRGNEWFQVVVEDPPADPLIPDPARDDGIGVFGAVTGPAHPRGEGEDIIASDGGTDAYSSFITVRSYSTGSDYVQPSDLPASGNLVIPMAASGPGREIDGGYDARYEVPLDGPTAEALSVRTAIAVEGVGVASAIRISGSVTNNTPHPVDIGARILLDVALAEDDGPVLIAGGTTYTREATIVNPSGPLRLASSEGSADIALVAGEGNPDRVDFAHWSRANETAFDYAGDGEDITSPGGLDDSAVLVYFGASPETATNLEQGETFSFAVLLTETLTEVCDNGSDDDGDTLGDSADPDCVSSTATLTAAPSASPTVSIAPQPSSTGAGPTASATPPGPAGFPTTGGPLGIDGTTFWLLVGAGAVIAATGGAAVVAARRR